VRASADDESVSIWSAINGSSDPLLEEGGLKEQECKAQRGPVNSDKLPDQMQKRSEGGKEFLFLSMYKVLGMEKI
jgi:hypothetical protein